MTVKAASLVDSLLNNAGTTTGSVTGSSSTSNSSSSKVSFSKVMSDSLSSNASNTSASTKNSQTSIGSKSNATTTNKLQSSNTSSTTSSQSTQNSTNNTKVSSSATDDQKSKISDQASSAVKDLKDEIEDELDVSDKDIEDAMAILGLNDLQLLQPDNLKQLVLQLTGQEDATSLLTNSDLLESMNTILDFLNSELTDMADSAGVSEEALGGMLEDLMNRQDATFGQAMDQVQDETVMGSADEATVATEASGQAVGEEVDEAQTDATNDDLAAAIDSKLTVQNDTNAKATSDQNGSSKNNLQNQDDTATDTTSQFSQNLVQTVQETFQTYMNGTETVDSVNIIRQVIDAVKVTTTSQLQSIEIQLNPENLGKVNLSVSARDGLVTAQITAENEQVKRAIESQMTTLKQDLEQQGIKIDAVEVTVRGHEFESGQNLQGENEANQQNNRQGRRKINLDDLNEFYGDEDTDEDQSLREKVYEENSSVSYTA